MPRPKIKPQSQFPYNVGGRCINREWFSLPMDQVWEIFCNRLYSTKFQFNLEIHSFVLMSNHFHLLVSTPDANLSQAMNYFMKNVSHDLTLAGNRINQTFGTRHFRSVVDSHHYFMQAYKYNYLNPVLAGICQSPEDYHYSTLSGLLGKTKLLVPVSEDILLFDDLEGIVKWLNRRPTADDWEIIGNSLKKSRFKIVKNRSGRPSHLETQLL